MAGTLTISTLSDGTNSTSSTNCIQGSAKAWCNYSGVTIGTVRTSYNVSSITRNGIGDYTVNFTNAFVDSNYAIACCATNTASGTSSFKILAASSSSAPTLMSTTQVRVAFDPTVDVQVASIVVFR